jgi:hypothetical protein
MYEPKVPVASAAEVKEPINADRRVVERVFVRARKFLM